MTTPTVMRFAILCMPREELLGLRELDAERQLAGGGEVDDLARAVGEVEHELVEVEQRRIEVARVELLRELLA